MHPLRYRRAHRLSGRLAYSAVFREGKPFHARGLVAIIRPNRLPYMRLGLSVGRRTGRAVIRNRIKRVLREGFRQAPSRLRGGLDVVIIPKLPQELQAADAVAARLDRILMSAHRKLAAGPRR